MIRLEMTATDRVTGLDGEGNHTVEITRQTLFLQEWQHGDGPDPEAIIALVNGLSRPVCHCGHRKESHTSYQCQVAGCDCRAYHERTAYDQQKLLNQNVALERKLAEEKALQKHFNTSVPEISHAMGVAVADAVVKRLKPKRRTAKKKAARGSAKKTARRR